MTDALDPTLTAKEYVEILPSDTLFSVWKGCVERGAELLPRVVKAVVSGEATVSPNQGVEASYYSFPCVAEIWSYRRRLLLYMLRRRGATQSGSPHKQC